MERGSLPLVSISCGYVSILSARAGRAKKNPHTLTGKTLIDTVRFMNKQGLVWEISKRVYVPQVEVEKILEAAIEVIQETVVNGGDVTLAGFGTFERSVRKARAGFDPHNEKAIQIPEIILAKFRAGKDFKAKLNKK
jgi:DNA-binding protein HU-beta